MNNLAKEILKASTRSFATASTANRKVAVLGAAGKFL